MKIDQVAAEQDLDFVDPGPARVADSAVRPQAHRRSEVQAYERAESPHSRGPLTRRLPVEPQDQGDTNACGTTSLATVMTYWGRTQSHEDIDAAIRHFDLFTAPDAIVAYANSRGMRSELKSGATLNDLANMIDQGVPPIVIIDPGSQTDASLHYVTVCGYSRDAQGKITELYLADSGYPDEVRTMRADEFSRQWGHLKLGGLETGLHNVMISVRPDDQRPITGADGRVRRADAISLPRSNAEGTAQSLPARAVASVVSGLSDAAHAVWSGIQAVGNAVKDFFGSLFG